jgi:hypothetical protein
MTTRNEIEKRLEELRSEYRKVYSMLSMLEKGTKLEDLVRLRKEQLDPIRQEIKKMEGELALLS